MSTPLLGPRERRAFVDSSAYRALLDRDDAYHAEAQAILEYLAQERFRLYTTNFIIAEAHALILSAMGRDIAELFVRGSEQSQTAIIRVRAQDEARGRQIIYQYRDKDFSLVDAISFAVMERMRISRAFTFDRHFSQYGFEVLRAH